MDIFNYALQFEKDGEAFYRESAAALKDKDLIAMLLFLAAEEKNHFRLIKNLKDTTPEHPKSIFISDISNVFSDMKAKNRRFSDPKETITALLTKAMKIEDESIAYYRKAQGNIDLPAAQALLAILARQEEAHYSLLSSIIEYFDTPQLWMEQAEFHNIKDY
jgi:rubrerythrin